MNQYQPRPLPKKKTEILISAQIEEHEIGLMFEEIECPMCGGGGEISEDWEGEEWTDECPDCGGSGVYYVSIY